MEPLMNLKINTVLCMFKSISANVTNFVFNRFYIGDFIKIVKKVELVQEGHS